MTANIGALLLAAGFSSRFGSAKLLARLRDGNTVFSQTRDRIKAALQNYVVVTRPELAAELRQIEANLQVFPGAEKGMGASLAYGIGIAQAKQWDACLVCLADMPFIATSTYQQLAKAAQRDKIILPCHDDKAGNPVVFGREFYAELQALSGDAGGRPVLRQHTEQVQRLTIDDAAILADVDTPQDLQALQDRFS